MVMKQNILCQCYFIINIFLTYATHMRNMRNESYAYIVVTECQKAIIVLARSDQNSRRQLMDFKH